MNPAPQTDRTNVDLARRQIRDSMPSGGYLQQTYSFLLAKALQKVHAALRPLLEGVGITPQQMILLVALLEQDGLTQTQLAARLGYDTTTVMHMIDRLERAGLVERHRDPNDRRVRCVHLTGQAVNNAADYLPRLPQMRQEMLAPLDEQERTELIRLLRKFTGAAADATDGKAPPPVDVDKDVKP